MALCVGVVLAGASAARGDEPGFKRGDWPFAPLGRPALPKIASAAWAKNSIDLFVLEKLEEKGLAPSAAADKRGLLRRVTFDLTGLAPTPAEQEAFLADDAPEAYERVVDRLLKSPHFGERWAQHWLDVVRYAETAGFKKDDMRQGAFRYRDYVIKALNSDLPYDRFVQQQLAGDELEPDNLDALVATGLNRLYPEETNASNFRNCRQEILDDITDITGLTFLGLTVGCAKCHDHKFDPILQKDFYSLQAFFTPILPRDDIPLATPREKQDFERKEAAWQTATKDLRARLDALLAPEREKAIVAALEPFDTESQQAVKTAPEKRTALQQQLVALTQKEVQKKIDRIPDNLEGDKKKQYEELQAKFSAFEHLKPSPLPTIMAVLDAKGAPPATFRLATGNYRKPLEEVAPAFPVFLGLSEANVQPAQRPGSSGRRAALARWLTRPDHPLTARVMINRIWQHHFGHGIVGSPNDFGVMGDAPTHRDLLDWLASEFVSSGWSMKTMHRLMVTSAAYRQSSCVEPDNAAHAKGILVDRDNKLLWHARRERLEAESIRDAFLQISGQLNRRMYGASARPELPEAFSSSRYAWEPDPLPTDRNRRSIYVLAKRNMRYPLLGAFDPPDMVNSCACRSTTTTAPQALALLNGEFALSQACYWSGALLAAHKNDDTGLITSAYLQAYGRRPSEEEVAAAKQFFVEQAKRIAAAHAPDGPRLLPDPLPKKYDATKASAIVDFCHAILNSSEMLYVD